MILRYHRRRRRTIEWLWVQFINPTRTALQANRRTSSKCLPSLSKAPNHYITIRNADANQNLVWLRSKARQSNRSFWLKRRNLRYFEVSVSGILPFLCSVFLHYTGEA